MPLEIREATCREISEAPNILTLLDEYGAESAVEGMPPPSWQLETYLKMEESGFLFPLAAYLEDEPSDVLVGFLLLLVTPNPHYGAVIAISESYFVGADYRSTGAGLRLLRAAERLAAAKGAVGLLVSSPAHGRLSEVLERTEYTVSNIVYFRSLA